MNQANRQQQLAINTLDGPVLIVAGPGSGKTFCLVERTAYLLASRSIEPERVLVATFTEKAATELRTRISNRLQATHTGINPLDLAVGTLHSIFLDMLDEFRAYSRFRRNYTILDQFDQQYFIYQHLGEFRAIDGLLSAVTTSPQTPSWRVAQMLAASLNKLSEEAINPEVIEKSELPELQAFGLAYKLYHRPTTQRALALMVSLFDVG